MAIIIIDNYDSFTWNLFDYFKQIRPDVSVFRNDEITITDLEAMNPSGIVLSPGPKSPAETNLLFDTIKSFAGKTPMLGICLGHQAIGALYGLHLREADLPMHGKVSEIQHNSSGLFHGLPNPMEVMRYHSLVLEEQDLPVEIEITARTDHGEIMALKHNHLPLHGVQFHPESILTVEGISIIKNWLKTL